MLVLGIVIFIIFAALGAFLIVKGVRQGDELDVYNTPGKGYVILGVIVLIFAVGLSAWCIVKHIELENMYNSIYDDYDDDDDDDDDYDYDYNGSSGSGSFTNKYGTSTTKCAVSGCSNYIAKSGDTNCCTTHSNKCGNCYCYIDGDAMYCMDCLEDALGGSGSNSGSSYGHECYICGDSAYSKYGSYYYCSDCLDLVKKFSD